MRVQKTVGRRGRTLEHGGFEARETVYVCAARCRHPSGSLVTRRSAALAARLLPGGNLGYDVMVFVACQRFLEHRQREEIRTALLEDYGLAISAGEISRLTERLVAYLEKLHYARSGALAAVLAGDGGWPLHIDATGENGRGTFLVARAGWRPWSLGAWKIPTECAEAILPCLRSVAQTFGTPLSIMRDLGRAITRAVDDFVSESEPGIRVLSCHLHFLRAVGKALLDTTYDNLRALFRRLKIQPGLAAFVRALGRELGPAITAGRAGLTTWQDHPGAMHSLPEGAAGLATVRSLAQWVLDYAADGNDQGYPFDRPYLDLYYRCQRARKALDTFGHEPSHDPKVRRAADKLAATLDRVTGDVGGTILARKLQAAAALFDELREALRLLPKADGRNEAAPSRPLSSAERQAELRDVEQAVIRLQDSLQHRLHSRLPEHTRAAIDLVLRYLHDHRTTLWGHVITLPPTAGGGVRPLDRTNNQQEHFFHLWKRGERRRSGRKTLTQDFENLPAATPLVFNLLDPAYVAALCGTPDALPAAFAALDAQERQLRLATSPPIQHALSPVSLPTIETASLPTQDRKLIRRPAMLRRILEAAHFRAPGHNPRATRPTG